MKRMNYPFDSVEIPKKKKSLKRCLVEQNGLSTQVNIIVVCESEFGVKFELDDIKKLKSVGDIADAIEGKMK